TDARVLYFGGVERPTGAPEGQPWRNALDAYAVFAVTDSVAVTGHVDAGIEPNAIGTSWWAAAAGQLKYALCAKLYVAVRGDFFCEYRAAQESLLASPIFGPPSWFTRGRATLAYHPADHISVRLEYRHDQAHDDVYFGGHVTIDPMSLAFVPNRDMQDTVLI